jgi:glycosyltransferase involved in cell wall biosynthesis
MTLGARSSAHAVQVSFFVDPEGQGGEALLRAWHTLPGVAAAAVRAGANVTIVQAATRREIIEQDGVTYHFVDDSRRMQGRFARSIKLLRPAPRLVDLVRALRPDVIHLHGFVFPFVVWNFVRAFPGIPLMVQDHSTHLPRGLRRALWRKVCRSIDAVAFTTREQARPFYEAGVFRPETKLFEILGGSSFFTPGDRDAARSRAGISGAPCILWVGRLDSNKDPLTALDAFELASPALPEARLWCVFREAPLLDAVRQRISRSSVLSERVTLLGDRPYDRMEDLFRAADLFVQTSHFEASGFSALEAMACGTPALLTDIPSFRRITNNGKAGSLTPVGDSTALADSMLRWGVEQVLPIRQAVRDWFERGLSFDCIGRDLHSAYESLAHTGRSST